MKRQTTARFLAIALALPALAFAQERGRTDGPENSEYGKGGYSKPGGGRFSLELNWGGSLPVPAVSPPARPVPLFLGLTGSFWADDWVLLDASAMYLFNSNRVNVLVGPRFRTGFYPVSFNAGLKAGAIFNGPAVRFGLSPQAGVDILIANRVILGLGYAFDWAVGGFAPGDGFLNHRIFMNIGYRF